MSAGQIGSAREAVYEAFATAWGATTPFCFDNEALKQPVAAPWVRFTVRHLASLQGSLGAPGNRRFERTATCVLQVFTPVDAGAAGADALVQLFRNTFEGARLYPDDIRFQAVTVREVGPTKDNLYQVNAECPFDYTEIR